MNYRRLPCEAAIRPPIVRRRSRAQTVAPVPDRPHTGALRTSQVHEPANRECRSDFWVLAMRAALGVHEQAATRATVAPTIPEGCGSFPLCVASKARRERTNVVRLGLPHSSPRDEERHLPQMALHGCGFETSPASSGCASTDNLDAALEGKQILIPPNSPSRGVRRCCRTRQRGSVSPSTPSRPPRLPRTGYIGKLTARSLKAIDGGAVCRR